MIDILLSTYNGSRWLDCQLSSIASQTCGDWHIVARDDGSTDSTAAILTQWQQRLGSRMTIVANPEGRNIGATRSFELLLNSSRADHIMFADQDDCWLPRKVELTEARMRAVEQEHPGRPALVFTSLTVVDAELHPTGQTFFSLYGYDFPFAMSFNNICVNNCVTGCTMMINRAARATVLPFGAHAPVHDWWIAARVARTGVLSVIEQPTLLYRTHGDNACGAVPVARDHSRQMLLHPGRTIARFAALKPFLREVGFGGMAKFYYYKTRHYLHRKLRKR